MTERERLLRRIATYDFAIVEFNLYLDTHPFDKEITQKLNDYTQKSDELRSEFERRFGPLTITDDAENRWAWIASPWPWDNSREDDD